MDRGLEQAIHSIGDALNERFRHCRTIGRLKAVHGLPTLRKTVEDVVKRRAREGFSGNAGKIDELFDHILKHSRDIQDHVREVFEEAGARAFEDSPENVNAIIDEKRKAVQQTDESLVRALNDFLVQRSKDGGAAQNAGEIESAVLNSFETPDDPEFDDGLRMISEKIAALA